jgi:hypothetical protein
MSHLFSFNVHAQRHLRSGCPRPSPRHSRIPTTELNQSTVLCPYSPDIEPFIPNSSTVRKNCSSRSGFAINCPFSIASSRFSHRAQIYLSNQTLDVLSYLNPLSSPLPSAYSEEVAALYNGLPFISRTFFPTCPIRALEMQQAYAPALPRFSRRQSARRRKRDAFRSALLVRVLTFSLSATMCLYRSEWNADKEIESSQE